MKVTLPRVTGNTPLIRLKVVLLPAPFGPIRPMISPELTLKEMSLTATRPPNSLRMASTSSTTWPACGRARVGRAGAGAGGARLRREPSAPVMLSHQPARIGHRPLRAYCSIRISSTPKTIISKLALVSSSLGRRFCS
ncbi:hypothetical protein D9M69_687920 [compost metagenome]